MNRENRSGVTARARRARFVLPPPAQLAQIAACLLNPQASHERIHLDAAIKEAAKLYLRAVLFCREHENDSLEHLALAAQDRDSHITFMIEGLANQSLPDWPPDLPKPEKFPATLKDFFRLVVKAKTPADCSARLRHFLTSFYLYYRREDWGWFWVKEKACPEDQAETKAITRIQTIKDGDKTGGYFSKEVWVTLARAYLEWWQMQKSSMARESARKRKRAS